MNILILLPKFYSQGQILNSSIESYPMETSIVNILLHRDEPNALIDFNDDLIIHTSFFQTQNLSQVC